MAQSQAQRPAMDARESSGAVRTKLQRRATSDPNASAQVAKETSMRRASAPAAAAGTVPVPKPKSTSGKKDVAAPPPPNGLRDGLRTQHISMLCALQVLSASELQVLLSQWQQEWLHTSGRATDVAVQAAIRTKQEKFAR